MTIPKAIEILSSRETLSKDYDPKKVIEALKLGIEALEREEEHRRVSKCGLKYLLPGETKE